MALDALILLLKYQIATGAPIPRPGKHRGPALRSIQLPALAAAKLELYWAWQAAGLSKSEFARRLNSPKTNLDRLLNLSHHSRLGIMEAAFAPPLAIASISKSNPPPNRPPPRHPRFPRS